MEDTEEISKDKHFLRVSSKILTEATLFTGYFLLLTPLDRTQVLLQKTGKSVYPSSLSAALHTLKREGFRAYWRGGLGMRLHAHLFAGASQSFNLQFPFLIASSIWMRAGGDFDELELKEKLKIQFLAMSGLTLVTTTVLHPLHMVSIRMSGDVGRNEERRYKGYIDCFKKTWAEGRTRGMFRGLSLSLLINVPSNAIFCSSYPVAMALADKIPEQGFLRYQLAEFAGKSFSFAQLATLIFYPLFVMRTAMMFGGGVSLDPKKPNKLTYKTGYQTISSLISKEGVMRIYSGAPITIFKLLLGVPIVFLLAAIDSE